jgi:predicted nucleic acid-binding protein
MRFGHKNVATKHYGRRRVITLDALAFEAYLRQEPAGPAVRTMFESGEQVIMTSISLGEVLDRMSRVFGQQVSDVQADAAELNVHITAVDEELVALAAQLRRTYYHREHRPVSLADCCAAAHALDSGSRLASSDRALLEVVRDEGGDWIALPNSFRVVADLSRWAD